MRRLVLALALIGCAAPLALGSPAGAVAGTVRKDHDVTMPDGRRGVVLAVPVDVRGLKGATIGAAVFFTDDAGQPVRAADPGFAGADGQLRVLSRDTQVGADVEALAFRFGIPYGAFPRRGREGYRVTGQVRVFHRAPSGRILLATSVVHFWVG